MLTLHECAHAGDGGDRSNWETVGYKVRELPPQEGAWIARTKTSWQILRVTNGVQGKWKGNHQSAVDALAALQAEIGASAAEDEKSKDNRKSLWQSGRESTTTTPYGNSRSFAAQAPLYRISQQPLEHRVF